jgi:tetratricopeptide (TPR) repeat protein
MHLTKGDKVERYTILSPLGEGGMGEVYCAHDDRLQRNVALKILRPPADDEHRVARTTGGSARLLREARAAAALEHPNVVNIYDVGEVQEPASLRGTTFLAMELIRGKTLREFVGDTSIPMSQRMGWLIDIARALAAAHKCGLVHRDIKPENVMIRDDGVVKVLDFGIAQRSRPPVDPTSSTEGLVLPTNTTAGLVIGTPYYMSPEQMRGDPLDGGADQFSWAVMAYELLSGETPWTVGSDSLKLVAQVLSRDADPLESRNPLVPSEAASVVMRALSKSRAARFPTMDDVITSLGEIPDAFEATRPHMPIPAAAIAPEPSGSTAVMAPATFGTPQTDSPHAVTDAVPLRTARARSPRAGFVAFVALAVGAAATMAVLGRGEPGTAARPIDADAPAGPKATACTQQPVPESNIANAATAYRAGLQAYCDDNPRSSLDSFQRAAELDPAMAAAHLRSATLAYGAGDVPAARSAMQATLALRGSLTEKDTAYAAMMEPLVLRTPPDLREAERHATDAIARWPLDAMLALERGKLRIDLGDPAGARIDIGRAAELDPTSAVVSDSLGQSYQYEGKYDEALGAFEKCLRQAPLAANCMAQHITLEAQRGSCEKVSEDAERVVTSTPGYEFGYRFRADTLAWRGAPPATLAAAIEQTWRHARTEQREERQHRYIGRLAAWTGDFKGAEAEARSQASSIRRDAPLEEHSRAAWMLTQALLEQGRLRDAGAVAADFLAQRDLWVASTQNTPAASDETPRLLDVAHRAGRLTDAEWAAAREAWVARWTAALHTQGAERMVKIAAYVRAAETREAAQDAVDRLPGLLPLTVEWAASGDFILGKAYFLAGRSDEALPYLERAAASCIGLESPVDTTRASLMLGHVLELKGDKARACAAYQAVLKRWGAAKPRSVSAEDARTAASRLGCAAL